MGITRQGETFWGECDLCGYSEELDTNNLKEAKEVFKEKGFRNIKNDFGRTIKICGGCFEERKEGK